MSSHTAAPRMICPSVDLLRSISRSTFAVMPMLVAPSVAAMKRVELSGMSGSNSMTAAKPKAKGAATPMSATRIESLPTLRISSRSASRPTMNNRKITP